jgi:uncharacterized protein YggE
MAEVTTTRSSVWAWLTVAFLGLVFAIAVVSVAGNRSGGSASAPTGEKLFEGLTSSGEGRASAAPDQAEVTVGVETRAAKANDAAAQNNDKASKIIAAVKQAGVRDEDVQTTNVSLFPEFNFDESGPGSVSGYVANLTVTITTKDVTKIGEVVDGALAAGATNVQGINFSFTPETRQRLEDEARKEASQDALRRATELAQLNRIDLGKALSVSESLTPVFPSPVFFSAADIETGGGSATPVEPGQLEVVMGVTVTYEID